PTAATPLLPYTTLFRSVYGCSPAQLFRGAHVLLDERRADGQRGSVVGEAVLRNIGAEVVRGSAAVSQQIGNGIVVLDVSQPTNSDRKSTRLNSSHVKSS